MVLILAIGTILVSERVVLNVPFQQESITRLDQARKWALEFIMFADAHGNQLPADFAQLGPTAGLSESNWEIVSGGNLNRLAHPDQTILLREKEARKSPRGEFVKSYAFADGHVDRLWSPDGDFSALEKKRGFLSQPARD